MTLIPITEEFNNAVNDELFLVDNLSRGNWLVCDKFVSLPFALKLRRGVAVNGSGATLASPGHVKLSAFTSPAVLVDKPPRSSLALPPSVLLHPGPWPCIAAVCASYKLLLPTVTV